MVLIDEAAVFIDLCVCPLSAGCSKGYRKGDLADDSYTKGEKSTVEFSVVSF